MSSEGIFGRPRGLFHHAFPIRSIQETKDFYGGVLESKEGRSTDTWVDFDFFGHQISGHISKERPRPAVMGHVDGVEVPIPHSGAIISTEDFDMLAASLIKVGVNFVIPPTVRYKGKIGEQKTMFFLDPAGNALEFKAFTNPADIYALQ